VAALATRRYNRRAVSTIEVATAFWRSAGISVRISSISSVVKSG
jgi:hypothetical protein